MRSLARDFSSSRRAPPNAASISALGQRVEQRFRLQQPAAFLRAERERIRALVQRFLILVHDQFRADFARVGIAKLDHLRKLVAGVDVQQRKRNLPGKESLLRQPQHHRGILADRIEHHRPRKFRHRFPQNIDALRLQALEVVQPLRSGESRGILQSRGAAACCIAPCIAWPYLFGPLKTKNPPTGSSGGGLVTLRALGF